jgi:hypothetical protein
VPADGIGAERVDFIPVPTRGNARTVVLHLLHHRYALYADGTTP